MTLLPIDGRQYSAAAERNRQPILQALQTLLPPQGLALEIASGTGQHAAWFAAGLPGWVWQTSDAERSGFASIRAWCVDAGANQVRAPVLLDVLAPVWPSAGQPFGQDFDAIFCANMLHISAWTTCAALMQGAARHLRPQGLLITYGPYLEDDVPTAPGNLAFDQSLRERNPNWGLRHLNEVKQQARLAGLRCRQRIQLPSNNLLLVFDRSARDGNFTSPL
jgi:SAM-dependent methyltransferase